MTLRPHGMIATPEPAAKRPRGAPGRAIEPASFL
jgi:hypothetical protein